MIRQVHGLFQYASLSFLAALSMTATAACHVDASGPAPSPPPPEQGISTEGFSSACDSTGSLASIRPDVPVDYLSRRTEVRGTGVWTVAVDQERGTPCATAKDRAACLTKVDGFRRLTDICTGDVASGTGCNTFYLLYTRGDEVLSAQSHAEEDALIGRVDNADEALLLASHNGLSTSCGVPGISDTRIKATADGYDILGYDETCEDRFDVLVRVGFDGRVTEVARALVPAKPHCETAYPTR